MKQHHNKHTTRLLSYKKKVDGQVKPSLAHHFNVQTFAQYLQNKLHLDVGCWNGAFISLCRDLTKRSVGLELQSIPLKIAKDSSGVGDFVNGSVLPLPFLDSSFEIATFLEVIEHLPEGEEINALKELNRVLVPDGYLLLSTPNNNPLGIALDPAYFLINHRHYSRSTLEKLMGQSGFEIVNFHYSRGIISNLIHLTFLFFKHILKRQFSVWPWLEKLEKREYSNNRLWLNSFGIHILAKKTILPQD